MEERIIGTCLTGEDDGSFKIKSGYIFKTTRDPTSY